MWEGIASGLGTVLVPANLMLVALGCVAGTFIGMLPGLGPISAIALMIETPSIIKRPVLDTGKQRHVGFKPDQYEQIFRK